MGFFSFRAGRILTLSDDGFPACREGRFKKCAKNLSIFPNDQALIKRFCLAVEEAAKKRTFRHRDWAMIYSQLMLYFGDRLGERA
jgi:transposase-like protein